MVKKEPQVIVSNTGPIVSLILIDKLQILQKLFGKVFITNEVQKEINNKNQRDVLVKEIKNGWLKEASSGKLDVIHKLDIGEETSVSLALQYKKSILLTDDFQAREFAKYVGLEVIGTLGILLLAKHKKLIPSIKDLIKDLIVKERWYSKDLIHRVLKKAGE